MLLLKLLMRTHSFSEIRFQHFDLILVLTELISKLSGLFQESFM